MQNWEKEIQDRQQAQIDHIEKSIDFSCDKAIENEIEKARSGIYSNTYQNRKEGLVGQKYGSEKKMTGDDLDAKYAQASQGKASPQEVADAHKKFSEQKDISKEVEHEHNLKEGDQVRLAGEKLGRVVEMRGNMIRTSETGGDFVHISKLYRSSGDSALKEAKKDNKKGSHVSDM